MKTKIASELKTGDFVLYRLFPYVVERYDQCGGMGSFTYGDYGILYLNKIYKESFFTKIFKSENHEIFGDYKYNNPTLGKNKKLTTLKVNSKSLAIQTYKNYPFVVWNEEFKLDISSRENIIPRR